jgi:UDP-glucuronate 4-epimerase
MSDKILVTGGAGFIGSHLIDRLMGKNEIFCVDNFDPYYDPKIKRNNIGKHLGNKNFILKETDVRDKKGMEGIFKEGIDKVVHLAAKAGVRASLKDPFVFEDVNIRGTLNLLDLCRTYGIRNFVYASSSSVYGLNKMPFREDDKVERQISPYGTSKRACELYCQTYSLLYNIPLTCLRFFTVYGPRQRPDMAIHKFTRLIDQGKPLEMYGDGKSKRDYTYVTDIVEGITSALSKKFDFEIFNLGDSKTVELKRVISLIEKNLGKEAKIKRMPDQKGDVPATFADISKSRRLLDYDPKVRIEEGVEKFVEWYRENKP